MKKKVLVVLAVAVMIFAFTACGGTDMSNSPYLGTWTATTAEYSGISVPVETAVGGEFKFVLNDDGTCDAIIIGEKTSGKWAEEKNGFSIEDEYTVVVDGDTGSMESEGMTINFERK